MQQEPATICCDSTHLVGRVSLHVCKAAGTHNTIMSTSWCRCSAEHASARCDSWAGFKSLWWPTLNQHNSNAMHSTPLHNRTSGCDGTEHKVRYLPQRPSVLVWLASCLEHRLWTAALVHTAIALASEHTLTCRTWWACRTTAAQGRARRDSHAQESHDMAPWWYSIRYAACLQRNVQISAGDLGLHTQWHSCVHLRLLLAFPSSA